MPLLDHFRPPLYPTRRPESFYVTWEASMADALNQTLLPDGYYADEYATFPGRYEVEVCRPDARLVAAIALVSPANKEGEAHRRAFAAKCAGRLTEGVALVIIDIVTNQPGNLHAEICGLLGRHNATGLPDGTGQYAAAYRPITRDRATTVDVWAYPLAVGGPLPTLPLALNAELCLPVDLEATYTAARARRQLG